MPFVSVVVPVRNEGERIDECLAGLTRQSYPASRMEVIVVDGNSTDDTAERVKRWQEEAHNLRLLDNPQVSMANGLNIGVHAARGEIVGVMSGHAVPAVDYVERAVEALRRTQAWAVGAKIERVAATPIQRAVARATASPFGVGDARHNYADRAQWVETAFPGMWPRDVFARIGFFDPTMSANEDNEFSYRIWKAGGRVWLEPELVVRYWPRASLGGLFRQYRQYALGKVRVFQRHPGALRWRHLIPPIWIASLAAGIGTSLILPSLWRATGAALVVYVGAVGVASARARREGDSGRLIAAAFMTIHVAYGLGFWEGVWRMAATALLRRARLQGSVDRPGR